MPGWSGAAEKFLELINTQTSRFSNPSLMMKEAKAKADATRLLAQAEHDAEQIRNGKLQIIDPTKLKLVDVRALENSSSGDQLTSEQRTLARLAHQEAIKDNNLQKVIAYAAQDIFENPTDKCDNIDEDLIRRIFEEAQFVSKEELQKIWAKLLSKSILRPEETSVDLLDFIKRMTNRRAEEVAKMASFVTGKAQIIRTDIEPANTLGLNFLMHMQALGLIMGAEGLGFNRTLYSTVADKFQISISSDNKVIIINHDDPSKTFTYEIFPLTELGMQVISLGSFTPNEEYFMALAQYLKNKHPDFKIRVADIIDKNAKEIRYNNAFEIYPSPK